MKFLSSATAALLIGTASIVAASAVPTEAYAQKKKGKKDKKGDDANAEPKASKGYAKVYGGAAAALEAGEPQAIKSSIQILKEASKTEADQYFTSRYQFIAARKSKDVSAQVQSLKELIANPVTPPKTLTTFRSELALLAFNELKDYQLAATHFQELYRSSGANPSLAFNAGLAFSRINDHKNAILWTNKAIDAQTAAGQAVSEAWQSTKRNNWYNAISPLRKDAYTDSLLNINYLRLLRVTDNMRFPSLFADYAEFGARFPSEVIATFDEGFASGIISKTDISFSELYSEAKRNAREINAKLSADEKDAANSPKGFLAMIAGDNLASTGQHARAIKMYELALQKGNIAGRDGVDQSDKVRLDLARAKIASGDKAGAKAEFAKLTNPKTKSLVEYWNLFLDTES